MYKQRPILCLLFLIIKGAGGNYGNVYRSHMEREYKFHDVKWSDAHQRKKTPQKKKRKKKKKKSGAAPKAGHNHQ